jgi:hypothetical protein
MSDHKSADRSRATDDSLLRLLGAVPLAVAQACVQKIPPALMGVLLTVCGLVLILSPLALWISWTTTIFNTVLSAALLALVIAFALIMLSREDQL